MEPVSDGIAALRAEYELGGLDETDLTPDPLTLFGRWFAAARHAGLTEPNAMVLATSVGDVPSSRTVLLKGVEPGGFVFFTNYESRKGRELEANPVCSLLFGWYPLQRQIRIEGTASRTSAGETAAYFAGRPRDSQIGAWASAQSTEVASRADLDACYAATEERFAGQEVPPPPHWGGYRVDPVSVEFWQGRRGRMHDRIVYRREGALWTTHRLAP